MCRSEWSLGSLTVPVQVPHQSQHHSLRHCHSCHTNQSRWLLFHRRGGFLAVVVFVPSHLIKHIAACVAVQTSPPANIPHSASVGSRQPLLSMQSGSIIGNIGLLKTTVKAKALANRTASTQFTHSTGLKSLEATGVGFHHGRIEALRDRIFS